MSAVVELTADLAGCELRRVHVHVRLPGLDERDDFLELTGGGGGRAGDAVGGQILDVSRRQRSSDAAIPLIERIVLSTERRRRHR